MAPVRRQTNGWNLITLLLGAAKAPQSHLRPFKAKNDFCPICLKFGIQAGIDLLNKSVNRLHPLRSNLVVLYLPKVANRRVWHMRSFKAKLDGHTALWRCLRGLWHIAFLLSKSRPAWIQNSSKIQHKFFYAFTNSRSHKRAYIHNLTMYWHDSYTFGKLSSSPFQIPAFWHIGKNGK